VKSIDSEGGGAGDGKDDGVCVDTRMHTYTHTHTHTHDVVVDGAAWLDVVTPAKMVIGMV
jgi:hypothetical protein